MGGSSGGTGGGGEAHRAPKMKAHDGREMESHRLR